MIDSDHKKLSLSRQCRLVNISRSSVYYKPRPISAENRKYMRLIDEHYLKKPFCGSRGMWDHLRRLGYKVNRKRMQRLMRLMGLEPIYPKPKTSRPHPAHKVYPYLLKDMTVDQPNQAWSADITYIPMNRGHMYLVAVMDWHSRKVLSFRVSNTLGIRRFVLKPLTRPWIGLIGHGSSIPTKAQFTSNEFTSTLKASGIAISMDGRGRCQDNIFIERLWWTLKYQYLYLHSFDTGSQLRSGLKQWIEYYNRSVRINRLTP